MSEKFPAWQFYPGDWKKDMGVQSLNYEEQGIWFNLLLFMFESEERGKLILNGVAMSTQDIADLLKLDLAKTQQTLSKLLSKGVAKKEGDGPVYNKRMVDDDRIRKIRAQSGAEGGKQKASKILANGKQKSTPSVSSSPSGAALPLPLSASSSAPTGLSPVFVGEANRLKNERKPGSFGNGVVGDVQAPESSTGAKAGAVPGALKEPEHGKIAAPYKIKDDAVSRTIYAYKLIKGFQLEDRDWDKRQWARNVKPAKSILEACKQNLNMAIDYMKAISKGLEEKGLDYTLETMVNRFDEWRLKNGKHQS